MLGSKFIKFLMSILKWQVNSSSNFASFFIVMTHNSSVDFKLILFLLWIKGSHHYPNFETLNCSGENLPYSSCHFPNHKSVFLQILDQSSGSWDITPLYLLAETLYFKEPIKVQIWWKFTWAVESLKFCTLMGSFCPSHVQLRLKKYRRVISHHTEQSSKI